jgi:hypothetical protein
VIDAKIRRRKEFCLSKLGLGAKIVVLQQFPQAMNAKRLCIYYPEREIHQLGNHKQKDTD